MKHNFQIREATREDSQIIYDFIVGIATYEKMLDEVEGDVSDVCETIFDKQQAHVLIAEEDAKPVGFAIYFYNYSTFKTRRGLYLEDIFVIPEMRGKGYGRALLLHLAKLAHEKDCGRMEWCCLDWNQASIAFYKSLGAIAMEEWTTYRFDENRLSEIAKELK